MTNPLEQIRELAERWRCRAEKGDVGGFYLCAAEVMNILDAEGDGGAVGEPAAWMMTCAGYGRPVGFYTEKPGFVPAISEIVPLYTHPARSGVVSDEGVYVALERFTALRGESPINAMRAALESYERNRK